MTSPQDPLATPSEQADIQDLRHDVDVADHGSVVLLQPLSDAARDWLGDHLPEDCQRLGDAYAVEPRYVGAIVEGLREDGLTCA